MPADAMSHPSRAADSATAPSIDAAYARASFIAAMRKVPGAVAIIATCANGARRGLAATAWTSLTADPPTLLVCVNRSASAYAPLLEAQAFTVNLLDRSHTETVAIFSAQRGLNGDDRFVNGAWSTGRVGQPVLEEAVVSFECHLVGAHEQGTHTLLIGEVADVRVRDDGDPLLYLDGEFAGTVRASGARA